MPVSHKLKKRIDDAFRADKDNQIAAQRYLCSILKFYIVCGRKKCRREFACIGDPKECFEQIWPIVPENVKIFIRTTIQARVAGLSPAAAVAEAERERARWRETMARLTAVQSASQTPSAAPAKSGPRLRVL